MDNKELEQKLLSEINKSGFPLELSVIEQLRDAATLVFPNLSFTDENDRPHEIDALAFLDKEELEKDEWPYGPIGLNLVVECKTSKDKPWVFFEEPFDPMTLLGGLVSHLKCVTDIELKKLNLLLVGCNNSALSGHHYSEPSIPVARTYFEAFGKDAGKDIHQAVVSVWHAIDFYERFFEESGSKRLQTTKKKRTSFVHGTIVLKGKLIVASRQGDTYRLNEEPHVMLRTIDCLTNRNLPLFHFNRETIIDVVREDYLEEYLSHCQNDLRLCVDHLKQLAATGWITGDMKANALLDDS